jgi:hypothetical protein
MFARIAIWFASPLVKYLGAIAFAAVLTAGVSWVVSSAIARHDARVYENGYHEAESKYKLQIAADDKKRAEEAFRAKQEQEKKRLAQEENIRDLSHQLIESNAAVDVLTKRLQERASNVSNFYRAQPGSGLLAVPRWIVTHGWVCDYNRAIGYGLSGAGAVVRGDENPSCAADAFGRSEVTGERILAHHEDYAAYCRKLEKQVDVLLDHIEFVERNKSK